MAEKIQSVKVEDEKKETYLNQWSKGFKKGLGVKNDKTEKVKLSPEEKGEKTAKKIISFVNRVDQIILNIQRNQKTKSKQDKKVDDEFFDEMNKKPKVI